VVHPMLLLLSGMPGCFFEKLPGAKQFISDFLNPKYPGMTGYPGYEVEEKEEKGTQLNFSKYDRFEEFQENPGYPYYIDYSDLASSDEDDENDEDSDEEPVHIDFDELNITDMKSAKKVMKIGKKTYY